MTEGNGGQTGHPGAITHHNIDVTTSIVQPAKQVLFTVSRTEVKLTLVEHLHRAKSNGGWTISGPFFLAILLTLGTASFHPFLKMPADTWLAVYFILLVFSGVHAVVSFVMYLRNRPMSIDDLVTKCINAQGEAPE
jgi:hypothetical protein